MVASCAPKTSDTTPTGDTTPTDTTPTDTTPAHEHSFGDWTVTTPATCGDDGVETRTCECGETETRPVPATENHTWGEWENTTPSTCTAAGEDTRTCSECGATDTREVEAGHKETTTTVQATLDTPAYDSVTCSECGEELRTENEDLWTARSAVQAFADEVFEDPSTAVRSAVLEDGTEVRYTGANFGSQLGKPQQALSIVMNQIFANLEGLDMYSGATSDGDGGYYSLYTYESDYTFLVVEIDAYQSSTNTIIQVMAYLD
ncbi:MAG: hypothetical protein MJ248_01760 [Bacilli bacterium]|nr:hypothetical protein [Bacilli bacterium]